MTKFQEVCREIAGRHCTRGAFLRPDDLCELHDELVRWARSEGYPHSPHVTLSDAGVPRTVLMLDPNGQSVGSFVAMRSAFGA